MLLFSISASVDADQTAETTGSSPLADRAVVTHHSASIDGRSIRYVATAGTLLLPDAAHPTASVFYVAYVAQNLGPSAKRPVTFAYSGGPGVSSALLHIGGLGPRTVAASNGARSASSRNEMVDNANGILDKTDLVFVDPVGTGFSRLVGNGTAEEYYGIDQDAGAFAKFIRRYLTANDRWNSPKYLVGISYGTTRSAVLAKVLESSGIAVSGITLMSTVLDFSKVAGSDDDQYWLYLPTETAVAAYHHKIEVSPARLPGLLRAVRAFAAGPFEQALERGDALPKPDVIRLATQIHAYIGLPVDYIVRHRLRVPSDSFRTELLRDRKQTIGLYDGRFRGSDSDPGSAVADSDPAGSALLGTYKTAFNDYVRDDLKYTTTEDYVFISGDVNARWDWTRGGGSPLGVDVSGDLAQAMRTDPTLRVLSVNGLYDLATPFFATEYQLQHLGLAPNLRNRISFRYYPAGHQTYLNPTAHAQIKRDLDTFYSTKAAA